MDNTNRECTFFYTHEFTGGFECLYEIKFRIVKKRCWIISSKAIRFRKPQEDRFSYSFQPWILENYIYTFCQIFNDKHSIKQRKKIEEACLKSVDEFEPVTKEKAK